MFLCFGECYPNMMSEVRMTFKWCHGPECHTRSTLDRVRGIKGNKVLRTRKITETSWNRNNVWSHFCSQGCWNDFMHTHWLRAIALGPRPEPLETPIKDPTKDNTRYYGMWSIEKKEVDNA